MQRIGPSFAAELESAGLLGLPISWNLETGDLTYDERLTPEQLSAVRAVLAKHNPSAQLPPAPQIVTIDQLQTILTSLNGGVTAQQVQQAIASATQAEAPASAG